MQKKGYIIGVLGPDDFKLTKGEDKLSLYQFYTNTAKHYFCSICGIHTHNRPRSNPKIYGVNIACIEGVEPFEIEDVPVNDGKNHPLDQKQKSSINSLTYFWPNIRKNHTTCQERRTLNLQS